MLRGFSLLISEKRPRDLAWYHAGPLLFGDWGTSRLYVLGLAFFYSAHASVLYLASMSAVMALVAWAYTIICRNFQDGGGVYTSARSVSQVLSVVGASLLLCDYIITAALSTVEAFHYFGTPGVAVLPLSILTIVLLGVLNWFGARSAGRFALVVALAAMGVSLVIAGMAVPYIREGIKTVSLSSVLSVPAWDRWQSLVSIMLALSGVEAVSNMTGLMKQPVERTARRTIWPVLAEVCIFNIIFGLALAGLPGLRDQVTPDYQAHVVQAGPDAPGVPEDVTRYRDTAMRVLAIESGQHVLGATPGMIFGKITAVVFGLLLLSATNTVIGGMVSVTYALGHDKELPHGFTRLNYSGVPWAGLVFACVMPCFVLIFVQDVMLLAELYAVGVVGAITINVLCCVVNRKLKMRRWERVGLAGVGALMASVELTLVVTKWHAAVFAGGMVVTAIIIRTLLHRRRVGRGEVYPAPMRGWLAELEEAPPTIDPARPRIMLATRGKHQADYAVDLAHRRGATLFAIYVRTLRVVDITPGQTPEIADDPAGLEALGYAGMAARRLGVAFVPIYVCAPNIAEEILDYTVTFGCDTLILGKSKRRAFARALEGDVISKIAQHLPEGVTMIAREHGAFAAGERVETAAEAMRK